MPAPKLSELFPEVELQKKGTNVPVDPTTGVSSANEIPGWWEQAGKHLTYRFMQGAASAKGSGEDAGMGQALSEPWMFSMMRGIGIPRDWVDKISPVKLADISYADKFGQEYQDKQTFSERLESHPSALVEHIGKGFRGAGGAIMTPVGGPMKLGTIAATGYGSGAAADAAKKAGEGVQRGLNYITGDETPVDQAILPKAAEFLGALGGGYLGTVKSSSITEGAKGGYNAVKGTINTVDNLATSVGNAVKSKRAGDERNLLSIFLDDYKMFDAKSKGIVNSVVAARMVDALKDDPNLQKNMQSFLESIGTATKGSNYKPEELAAMFDTAQRTGNPALAALILERKERPIGLQKAGEVANREGALRTAIADIFGTNKKEIARGEWYPTIDEAFNGFIDKTKAKLSTLDVQAQMLKGDFASLNATDLSNQGKAIKAAFEAEKSVSKNTVDSLYAEARNLGAQHGPAFKLQDAMVEADAVLGEAGNQISGGGTVIRRLKDYLTPENGISFNKDGSIDFTKPLTYTQADDVGKALNSAISDAKNVGDSVKVRKLTNLKKTVNEEIYSQARQLNPMLAEARQKADAYFANEHAPRFNEGFNANLDREAGRARPGTDYYQDVDVMGKYIPASGPVDEETLRQFDKVFGGEFRGGTRREEAYAQMGQYVENLYKQKVLRGDFDLVNHEKFISDMDPVFNRVPGLREKIDNAATEMLTIQGQKRAIEDQAKYLLSNDAPLSKLYSEEEAAKLYAKVLSDPRKMSKLIDVMPGMRKPMLREAFVLGNPVEADGTLNAEKLRNIIYAGRGSEVGGISGLQTLIRSAYGKETGDAYFKRLESLLTLVERENLTSPRFVRPKADELIADPVTGLTGQSPQSYISQIYAWGSGRVNPAYLVATPISRFATKVLGQKIAEAEEKLLHTPDGVNVLLELRDKGPGEALSKKSLDLLEGAAKGIKPLWQRVFNTEDIGNITKLSAQRAVATTAQDIEKDRKERKGK